MQRFNRAARPNCTVLFRIELVLWWNSVESDITFKFKGRPFCENDWFVSIDNKSIEPNDVFFLVYQLVFSLSIGKLQSRHSVSRRYGNYKLAICWKYNSKCAVFAVHTIRVCLFSLEWFFFRLAAACSRLGWNVRRNMPIRVCQLISIVCRMKLFFLVFVAYLYLFPFERHFTCENDQSIISTIFCIVYLFLLEHPSITPFHSQFICKILTTNNTSSIRRFEWFSEQNHENISACYCNRREVSFYLHTLQSRIRFDCDSVADRISEYFEPRQFWTQMIDKRSNPLVIRRWSKYM